MTDWKFEKDVLKNLARLKLFKNKNKIQCLLITEQQLKNSLNKINQPSSNYKKLIDKQATLDFPFIILTWEALIRDCENQNIKAFFEKHLKKGPLISERICPNKMLQPTQITCAAELNRYMRPKEQIRVRS